MVKLTRAVVVTTLVLSSLLWSVPSAGATNQAGVRINGANPCSRDQNLTRGDGGTWSWNIFQSGVNPNAVWSMTTHPSAVMAELTGPNGRVSHVNHTSPTANTDAVFVAWFYESSPFDTACSWNWTSDPLWPNGLLGRARCTDWWTAAEGGTGTCNRHDVEFNANDAWAWNMGSGGSGYALGCHETGHAFGLTHAGSHGCMIDPHTAGTRLDSGVGFNGHNMPHIRAY